jgi:hypothetical protein
LKKTGLCYLTLFACVAFLGCKRQDKSRLHDEGHYLDNPPTVSAEIQRKIVSSIVQESRLGGTAFYINDKYLALTNYHVVFPCLEKKLDELRVSSEPILLSPPLDCGWYEVVALPPDPFQRTLETGFYGDVPHANKFLMWSKTRTDKNLVKKILVGELQTDDWALIKIKDEGSEPSQYLPLSSSALRVGQKLVGFGHGKNLNRYKNLDLVTLKSLKINYSNLLNGQKVQKFHKQLDQSIVEIDAAIAYRSQQDQMPQTKRDFPDPSVIISRAPRFAIGSIKKDGNFVQEWQTDLSLEYLRPLWFPKAVFSKGQGNDERVPIWLNAWSAISGIKDMLKVYKADVKAFSSNSRSQILTNKMRFRLKNILARKNTDMNHPYYREEANLIQNCLTQPSGIDCKNQSSKITDVIQSQIDLWTTDTPSSEQVLFFSAADRTINDAMAELQQLSFNKWGFVSNVDLVMGHSGSPLVDISTGEVVGIHRAAPWEISKFLLGKTNSRRYSSSSKPA